MAPPLRVGDVVEVRSPEEILATLDRWGSLEGLPFMPEMLEFCGQRLVVTKRADKTCDTIEFKGLRGMTSAVHLADARCTGASHGGCQAACRLFWKEAWLRRVPGGAAAEPPRGEGCTVSDLETATRQPSESGEPRYRCQATELLRATTPLRWWDVRQYARDVRSGNVSMGSLVRSLAWSVFKWCTQHVRGYRLQVWLFNTVQRLRGGAPFREIEGTHGPTPSESLNLASGDLVTVKEIDEIQATLDDSRRNRGLLFDEEMLPYCGGTYRVQGRVTRLIDEATGRMRTLSGGCWILEGVVCAGRYHRCCPRGIHPYWREIWLRPASRT